MTRDEGVTLIQDVLAFRTDRASTIVTHMQLAQQMLEIGPTKPWFMRSERSVNVTEDGEQRVAVPEGFIAEVDDEGLVYVPDDEDEDIVQLFKDEFDELQKQYIESEAGAPEAYALSGEYFWIFPVPDGEYTIRMVFFERQTSLATNVENNWLKWVPYLLLGTAGLSIAQSLRDQVAAQTFTGWIGAGLKALNLQDTQRDVQNRVLQMGGKHV